MVSDDIGNAWYCIVLHSFAWLIRIDTIVVIWSDCHATGVGQSKILEKQGLGAVDYDDDLKTWTSTMRMRAEREEIWLRLTNDSYPWQ